MILRDPCELVLDKLLMGRSDLSTGQVAGWQHMHYTSGRPGQFQTDQVHPPQGRAWSLTKLGICDFGFEIFDLTEGET